MIICVIHVCSRICMHIHVYIVLLYHGNYFLSCVIWITRFCKGLTHILISVKAVSSCRWWNAGQRCRSFISAKFICRKYLLPDCQLYYKYQRVAYRMQLILNKSSLDDTEVSLINPSVLRVSCICIRNRVHESLWIKVNYNSDTTT